MEACWGRGPGPVLTSTWLRSVLTKRKPGMRLSLQTTPTSSECLQSDTPMPLEGQSASVVSLPLQCRLSNQMGPEQRAASRPSACPPAPAEPRPPTSSFAVLGGGGPGHGLHVA